MKELNFIFKDFSKLYTSIKKNLNKISSNLIENAFESSLFHTFKQQ